MTRLTNSAVTSVTSVTSAGRCFRMAMRDARLRDRYVLGVVQVTDPRRCEDECLNLRDCGVFSYRWVTAQQITAQQVTAHRSQYTSQRSQLTGHGIQVQQVTVHRSQHGRSQYTGHNTAGQRSQQVTVHWSQYRHSATCCVSGRASVIAYRAHL